MIDLQIYFGLSGDNPVCHKFTTTPGNYAGKIVAGPKKLLDFLELHLGLTGIFLSETERVLLLKEKFSELSEEEFPFITSFNHDPIGVSRRLLILWDSWRIAGWQTADAAALPKRMKQLLSLQAIFDTIGMGLVERITAVLIALETGTIPYFTLHTIDATESFPYLYQQLLKKLQQHISVIPEIFTPQANPDADLGKLQIALLTGNKPAELINDGTLQILYFTNDILAAYAVKSIQAASNWNPVLINRDNSLLNGLNYSHNLPVCKWQTSAGNGQVTQLFFLATALFRQPVNTAQVLAFLGAPLTPFPKKLAGNLLKLFSAKPGFGSMDWQDAVNHYLASIKGSANELSKNKMIAFWLQNKSILQEPDLEINFLISIYTVLGDWALQATHFSQYEVYKEQLHNLSNLCTQLNTVLIKEGVSISVVKFERLQVELFVEIPSRITEAQAGCADIISAPGAVWSAVKEVLWMDAVRVETGNYLSKYWYQEEKEFFEKQRLPVNDESHGNTIYNDGLKRMVLCAKDRLVIVVPQTIKGAAAAKPFCLDEWDKLIQLNAVTTEVNGLLTNIPWGDKKDITGSFKTISLPVAKDYLEIPEGNLKDDKVSFSSLEKLFQHPAYWFLKYQLKLKYKEGISLPSEAILKGTVADTVVQQIFNEANRLLKWWKDELLFMQQVEIVFQEILLKEGLPFLEIRSKRFLQVYQQTLCTSLVNLRNFIECNQFTIKSTQLQVNGTIDNTPFEGFIDLLLTKNETDCVIDLKWAGSSKKYIDKLKDGTDLQLALYQMMETKANKSGFFLLNDGIMYMRNEYAGLNMVTYINAEDGVSSTNVHNKAINSLQYRRREMQEGKAEIAYDINLTEIAYYNDIITDNLLPLSETKKCKQAPYDNDFDLFFGKIS